MAPPHVVVPSNEAALFFSVAEREKHGTPVRLIVRLEDRFSHVGLFENTCQSIKSTQGTTRRGLFFRVVVIRLILSFGTAEPMVTRLVSSALDFRNRFGFVFLFFFGEVMCV